MMILGSIEEVFGFCTNTDADPFMMWHDQQMAIAEIMTIKDEDGESCCLSYALFHEKYCNDVGFKKWFRPIEKGIDKLVIAREEGNPAATFRLRKLQHHLIDFILVLELETGALRMECLCVVKRSRLLPRLAVHV
ncbi:hypothetical protein OCU04_000156 [Sclerotinia nivalis]|uniref:Uncharacterized protein n=1 Tax=Sclerotinia nivalis TaxID=352851 RepID=A0A9X0AVH3_9HELO|nr:hypothetical protein OCU04_000156 [Sclerotinia nivalis]